MLALTETPWSKGRELCSPMSSCRSRNSFECARASATWSGLGLGLGLGLGSVVRVRVRVRVRVSSATSSFTAVFSTARCARRERVASAVCCGAGGEKVRRW